MRIVRCVALAAALLAGWGWRAAPAAELAPTGTLRAVFLRTNPVQGVVDPATGAVSGPAADLTAALARSLGVAHRVTPVPGTAPLMAAVRAGEADIGFLAIDPARATEVAFSQAYSIAYNSFVVPAAATARGLADLDRPGVRIGVGERDAADLFLTRTVRQATLHRNRVGTTAEMLRMIGAGEVDAYAANRTRLIQAGPQLPGWRLLDENFLDVQQAIVVAPGDPERLAAIDRFLDGARASGLIRDALERAGLRGVDVAPPRRP